MDGSDRSAQLAAVAAAAGLGGGAHSPTDPGRKSTAGPSESTLAESVLNLLQENMTNLEAMQEQRIRMLEEHEEEKERLREELMQEWEVEKASLESAMETEKAAMEQDLRDYRREFERKMQEEAAAMEKRAAQSREECERRIAEEKTAMERGLTEARSQMEAQIQREQEVTAHVMKAIRELPPLQIAMQSGNITVLEDELQKWKGTSLPERFGDCKGVVEAVMNLARERLITWRGVDHTLTEVLNEVEHSSGSARVLVEHCQRLLRILKEAQLTQLMLSQSNPGALEQLIQVFLSWQQKAMANSNAVQRLIVRKVATWPQLGPFDFVDLDVCLRLVDRGPGPASDVFLSRAHAIVQDEATAPKDLKGLLSHIETMLFFLKYVKSEDIALTHLEFQKQNRGLGPPMAHYLQWAAEAYAPGSELVRLSDDRGLVDEKDVTAVLEELRSSRPGAHGDILQAFREIFYHWALAMRSRFNLLVLPHHTQVVCLLAFQRFLQCKEETALRALIAQIGTGEGKSMIVAALSIYVVTVTRKKVHVVVDDETLLERDFVMFKRLFDTFTVPMAGEGERPLSAVLCVSEERLATSQEPFHRARVDADADICYCEAKHVQSFYASIARGDEAGFDFYDNCVLLLDEVDALVIDEEPNEAFVYPNSELSEVATKVAKVLAEGAPSEKLRELQGLPHPAAARVVREMSAEWERGRQMKAGEDFAYMKDVGKYCILQSGRANPKAWSLALECRNFQDRLDREILFQERMFVMSRPRVFRRYHRLMGLSGSIGSAAEREFLRATYNAEFFEVPPFLRTCRGSPFHSPVPALLGPKRQAVYLEPTYAAQVQRLAEVAMEARERVPVLVIARDRAQADQLVERLRTTATTRGLGSAGSDVVRSLSRTLYEADPEQWKENLNRATMAVGDGQQGKKVFRITVTDPRGGRGTDYRVDDLDVDEHGGLLLIPTAVPTSQRDWTQFLGRTARQDRKGQFCLVLCSEDYEAPSKKFNEPLPVGGSLEAVNCILRWGDRMAAEKIQASAALYNTGVRVNEVCEAIFSKHPSLLKESGTREQIVDICQRYRWMSVKDVDAVFSQVKGLKLASIPTEAKDLGRPEEPPQRGRRPSAPGEGPVRRLPERTGAKVLIFCLDWSTSMKSKDTGTHLTRFGTCIDCVRRIMKEQVGDEDFIGVMGFGANIEVVLPLTKKARAARLLEMKLNTMQPESGGGTRFFDAVAMCIDQLHQQGTAPASLPRWLVCLTDGDDIGSRGGNTSGEAVTQKLLAGAAPKTNMAIITVGTLKEKNLKVIEGWVAHVSQSGAYGQLLSEQSAASIRRAFDVVAEVLAVDVGGAMVC